MATRQHVKVLCHVKAISCHQGVPDISAGMSSATADTFCLLLRIPFKSAQHAQSGRIRDVYE